MDNTNRPVTIWNRTFVCCLLINIFFCFSHFFTSPLVSTYAQFLGAGATIIGMLSGLYFGIAFAMRPVSGPAVTYGNKKILMIAAFALGAIINIFYASFTSIPLFVMTRVLHGIQYSVVGSLCLTVASASLPKEKIGSGIGIFGVTGVFGTALGPSIGIALRSMGDNMLGEGGGYRMVFLASAFCCVLALIPCFIIKNQPALTREQRKEIGPWYKNIVTLPAMPSAFIMFFYSMAFILFNTFMVPYAAMYGIPGVSTFFIVYAVTTLVSRPICGKIMDKHGTAVLFFPCTALFIISMIMVAMATSLPVVLAAAVVSALGWGPLQPAIQAMAMASVPLEKGGVASNTNYFGLDLGYFLGPTLGGLVFAATGSYRIMFLSGIIGILLGFIVYLWAWSRQKRAAKGE